MSFKTSDINTEHTFRTSDGDKVTLNMNGHELDHGGAAGSVIEVTGEGTKLTINADDEETGEKGVITGGTGAIPYPDSTVAVPMGGGLYVHDGASLEMTGGEISENRALVGATLHADKAKNIILNQVSGMIKTATKSRKCPKEAG